jgi:hypothetical protein
VSSPWTKKFIIAHSVELAANIFDIESSQHSFARGCVEGGFDGGSGIHRPSRTEMYTQDMISFAVLGTLDWTIQRSHPPKALRWMPYANPAYGTIQHMVGGLKGVERCC